MKRSTLPAILFLVAMMNMIQSNAFVQRRTFYRSNRLNDGRASISTPTGSSSSTITPLAASLSHPFDPSIEAELCTTMAHVALDFSGLVSPSRSIVRLLSVIGRLFAISADYLPDHSIHTEELMIQIFLLSLALRELVTDRFGSSSTSDGRA